MSCGDQVVPFGHEYTTTGYKYPSVLLANDGNSEMTGSCSSTWNVNKWCGDGIEQTQFGDECDDGASNSDVTPDACRTTCELPSCGDNVTDTGEECDDGNTSNGDGCSSICEVESLTGDCWYSYTFPWRE
ncbi:MAG: DUF4215 domain-containing protein [Candidatus Peribacteria bacterium]|nr:MAG: DUF4215 domain-containing protein [Candidatus Peribacteria bacterium]